MEAQLFTQMFVDCKVMVTADELIEYGISKRWFFTEEDMKGVIEEPILKDNWRYKPFDPNSTIIHPEAKKRLDAVLADFGVMQVIYGEETEEELEVKPVNPMVNPATLPDIPADAIAAGIATVMIGAAAMLAWAFLAALSGIDPKIIVVTADSRWTCLFSWEKS